MRDRAAGTPAGPPARPLGTGAAVARFVAGSLVAIAVIAAGGYLALRSAAIEEAERDTREQVQLQAALVEAAGVEAGLLEGDPAALARLDALVLGRILDESVVRVKVWAPDGRILYSDEPAIIGERYELDADELAILRRGGAEAELSELSRPENRYERQEGKLLEAYTAIRAPDDTQLLFETYKRFDSVTASGERILRALALPLLGGLLVLLAFQIPLAWSMTSRLRREHSRREALLASAVEASARERQRIAADLHDGVVQDLAGVAFGLAPLAEEAERRGEGREAGALRDAVARLRQGIRGLRTLLVEIHPPNLESTGLEAALADLLSPLREAGVEVALEADDQHPPDPDLDPLVYRVANEAIRNVTAHAGAGRVRVELTWRDPGRVLLRIEDDGRGFDAAERERRAAAGHLGLSLLEDLAAQAGGELSVVSAPGAGTRVELRVPRP